MEPAEQVDSQQLSQQVAEEAWQDNLKILTRAQELQTLQQAARA